MNNPTWTGVLHPDSADFTSASPTSAVRRAPKRVWGVICGLSFLVARGSIYLLVLPFAVLVTLSGLALYAVQAVGGGSRG
jgi:hypothetical protein